MKAAEYLADTKTYVVPPRAWNYNPYALPMSVRLMKMLREKNVERLGDLRRFAPHDVMLHHNCGRATCKELARLLQKVSDGKYDRVYQVGENPEPGEIVKLIDQVLKKLPAKKRSIFFRYYGAEEGVSCTLEDVASEFDVRKAYVGAVVSQSVERVSQYGGVGFKVLFENISAHCSEKSSPLTPELLSTWLEQSGIRPRHSVVFYVRLVGVLCPEIPVWYDGATPRTMRAGRKRTAKDERALCP